MAALGRKEELSASLKAGSEEFCDFYCQPCSHDNKHLSAEGYCVDCKEYLCGTCFKYHRKLSATRHHVLLDKKNMPLDRGPAGSANQDVCTDPCPNHTGKTAEYYCPAHDQLGCSACMTVSHRGCIGVDYIPDISSGIEKTQEFINMMQNLNELNQTIQENGRNVKENFTAIDTTSKKATAEIRKFRNEVNELFDTLEDNISQKVKVTKEEDTIAMNSISDECDSVRSDILHISSDFDSKQKDKQNCQLFVAMKKAEKEIKSIKHKMMEITNKNKIRQYKFVPEKKITDLVRSLNKLGDLSFVDQKQTEEETSTLSEGQRSMQTHSTTTGQETLKNADTQENASGTMNKDVNIKATKTVPSTNQNMDDGQLKPLRKNPTSRKVEHSRDINVKLESDEKIPNITGLVVLSDGQLAVADFNNICIKLIDTKNNKITSYKTSPQSWDVAEISSGQLAATCLTKIILLSVSGTPYLIRKIDLDGWCESLVYSKGRLIVSYSCPPDNIKVSNPTSKVDIMDTQGTVLHRIITDSSGEPLFKNPQNLALSPDGNTFYVSDKSKNKVTSLTLDGQVKHKYSLEWPKGLATDKYGLVFVCGLIHVFQLTPDLSKVHKLLGSSVGLKKHRSIAYCDKEDKLYVGMDSNDNIKVFQLK